VIPPERDARFVAAMEAVLDIYAEPPDPARPLVCFDEAGKELRAEVRAAIPAQPGQVRRQDPEYRRQGSANLFMVYAPWLGTREVLVTTQRTAVDFALAMRDLVDRQLPDAEQITVVLDNLNIHHPASLYTAFPAPEAHRLLQKLRFCFTPRHGSWLNMAELELAVLSRQCLDRRIPDRSTLAAEVAAWVQARNVERLPAHWTFRVDDARTRLTYLYPVPVCDTST
jgi:hypothetical protein